MNIVNKGVVKDTKDMSKAELLEAIAVMKALNAQLAQEIRCKVTPKGGFSIYGLGGRWPVTFYRDQYRKLRNAVEQIDAFVAANEHLFTSKNDDDTQQTAAVQKNVEIA